MSLVAEMAKFDVSEHLSAEARRRPAGKLVALVEKFSGTRCSIVRGLRRVRVLWAECRARA